MTWLFIAASSACFSLRNGGCRHAEIHRDNRSRRWSAALSRRELIAGAGIGSAALLLDQAGVQAQPAARRPIVFTHTTVANAAAVQDDVALAVVGDKIAAIGPTDAILRQYRQCRNL